MWHGVLHLGLRTVSRILFAAAVFQRLMCRMVRARCTVGGCGSGTRANSPRLRSSTSLLWYPLLLKAKRLRLCAGFLGV